MEASTINEGYYNIFYLQYDLPGKEKMDRVLDQIAFTYATFKYLNYCENLQKVINKYYHEIKLTKRKIVFAVVIPPDNPEVCPATSKKIVLTPELQSKEDVLLNQTVTDSELETELIKRFQLDSVWVGLLYRIGADVEELEEYLQKEQEFTSFEVSFMRQFYEILEEKLQKNQIFSTDLLKQCKQILQQSVQMQKINYRIEELIRAQFNTRIIIKDITNHTYLHLLSSRNYFNLLYIEGQITKRFENFQKRTLNQYPYLKKVINFYNFMHLDDYVLQFFSQIYSQFIFGCVGKAKRYINRTLQQDSYSDVVARHHRDIIREFRPSYNEYFLSICQVLKERAACLKEAVGSVIVKNNKIISTGYNGTPVGTINCYNGGCQVCNNSEKMGTEVLSCRCIHAEYNCILKAGIRATPGTTLYSTKLPCLWCAKLIIQGRVSQVIYLRSKYSSLEYQNVEMVKKTLKEGKVEVLELDIPYYD